MQLQAALCCTYTMIFITIFKINHKLYIASGSAPPKEKFWVRITPYPVPHPVLRRWTLFTLFDFCKICFNIKITFWCDMTPYNLVDRYKRFGGGRSLVSCFSLLYPEDVGSILVRYVGTYLPNHTVRHNIFTPVMVFNLIFSFHLPTAVLIRRNLGLSGQTFCEMYPFCVRSTCHAYPIFPWFDTRFEPRPSHRPPSLRHPWFCVVSQYRYLYSTVKYPRTAYTDSWYIMISPHIRRCITSIAEKGLLITWESTLKTFSWTRRDRLGRLVRFCPTSVDLIQRDEPD
jgi:hypothetical protein